MFHREFREDPNRGDWGSESLRIAPGPGRGANELMPRWNLLKRGWLLLCFVCSTAIADWPGLRGSPDHAGLVRTNLDRPLRLLWAREFTGERLGTAMEPIVAGGKQIGRASCRERV